MKAEDLRIGNCVKYLGEITIVNSISGIETTYVSTLKSGIMPINSFQPIPLTEELLLKCGFEYVKPYGYRMILGCFIKDDLETNGYYFRWNGQTLKLIHYVHDLQNLYFALTNQELTINL